jgi:hypothetical protein
MQEEGGGLTPSLRLTEGHPEDNSKAPPATGLVRTPPSANIEEPGHSAQDITQEKQALALLSIPSLAFNPHLRPTPETTLDHFTKALVDELGYFARSTGLHKQARQPADRLRFNASIEALACNLILAAVTDAQHLTLWADRESTAALRYNGECTGLPFRNALDLMESFEFMRLVQVGMRTSYGVSLQSRFAIGDALTDRWRRQQQQQQAGNLLYLDMSWIRDTNPRLAGAGALLVLKGADGEAIPFKETARTKETRAQVARFNRILAEETPLAIFNPDRIPIIEQRSEKEEHEQRQGHLALTVIDPTKRTLHRSFNNGSWERGGRFYGGFWQTMHREDRPRFLRLGNSFNRHQARQGFAYEEIANVDFRQLYLRLAYLHLGLIPPEGDLYAIPGYEGDDCREGLKIIVNAMLFLSRPLKNWPRKARTCFPKGTILGEVKDVISIKHWPIHDLFEAEGMIGHRFAFLESQMLVRVLRQLYSAEVCVPALPLHDSVLVARSNAALAKEAMLSAFEAVTGVKPEQAWVSISHG